MSQSIFQPEFEKPNVEILDNPIAPTDFLTDLQDGIQETTALTRRLFIQLIRRPSTLIAGLYSVADPNLLEILAVLYRLYCPKEQ